MPVRIAFDVKCNTDEETIKKNLKKSEKYTRLKYDYKNPLRHPTCAIVGGGPSTAASLDILREWKGDIFAINDTAGYLSDNGIASFLYSIDCSRYPYKIGPLVKGALFASRVHRKQFNQFRFDQIRTFDLAEDYVGGATGGGTGACRAPMQMLRMGYRGVAFFGCDGSFSRLDQTHVSGTQQVAYEKLMIVRVNGVDYLTNASLTVQSEYLAKVMRKFPQFLINASGGLLSAMIEFPDSWECAAVTKDLKDQIETRAGVTYWPNDYKPEGKTIWQQPGI